MLLKSKAVPVEAVVELESERRLQNTVAAQVRMFLISFYLLVAVHLLEA
jgi:hypothetical protein